MRAPRIRGLIAAGLLVAGAVATSAQPPGDAPEKLPPPRPIPGITADDPHPGGCVDCHVNMVDMNLDARLSTAVSRWAADGVEPALLARAQASAPAGLTLKGRHPALPASAFRDVPAGCLTCHGRESRTAPPMNRLAHAIHLTGGAENVFLTVYQGECTHCHKLDQRTGAWRIVSGPER